MTPTEATEIINRILLFAFTGGVLVGFTSTAYRLLSFWRGQVPRPYLIWRDLAVFGQLSFTFLLIALARVFEWEVQGRLWWTLITALPAVSAVWVYVYFEILVIGHRRDRR